MRCEIKTMLKLNRRSASFFIFLNIINKRKMQKPEQLTFGRYGHTLHHCQVISKDNQWIVYDTRNEDPAIGTTTRIERVHVESKKVEVLYEIKNSNPFGPGVGAATFSPIADKVLFIHGLQNANEEQPYGQSRRSGVAIDVNFPNQPIHMDARDVVNPYTNGALRGGTHSHCWHPEGNLISFTYNDEVAEMYGIPNERMVGVMFPKKVEVASANGNENFSGEMFSFLVSKIVEHAKPGSDEIEKAFDECWVGKERKIAFQGFVRDGNGNRKTEIFMVDIPSEEELNRLTNLQGTKYTLPIIPSNLHQYRVTYTPKGISNFRHWLRSSPNGEVLYFLKEDDFGVTQLYNYNIIYNKMTQMSFHSTSIHSPININTKGDKIAYYNDNKIVVVNVNSLESEYITEVNENLEGIPNWDLTGKYVFYNAYVRNEFDEKFLQIFKIPV